MIRSLLAAVLGLALTPVVGSAADAPPASGPTLSPELAREYVRPHELVDIGGGRKLNLVCMGSGERTVLFDSGGSDWSVIWSLVQPEVAKGARACAYDRAGLGYSDPAMLPRTPVAIVEDMHALIVAAKLPRPLVLVGHSLGGFNVKLYAALYPDDVAGLVLVDPSEERAADRTRIMMTKKFGAGFMARAELLDQAFGTFLLERYRRCAEASREGPLDPASLTYRRCSDPVRTQMGDVVAAERQRIQVGQAYQAAQASEILNSIYGDTRGDPIYAGLFRPGAFGDKPMVVLTHGNFDPEDPLDAASQTQIVALHTETAALSRRGRQRVVPNTNHNIELDDPKAIVDAVATVLAELEAAGKTR
ncbi:MAG TPA: alpha/beta hydrolase [Caulobacteraceae bacterium]|nr:alpha/beta hydrolase [Caulobacteraceae bacterium]